jgi:hypothetical protein
MMEMLALWITAASAVRKTGAQLSHADLPIAMMEMSALWIRVIPYLDVNTQISSALLARRAAPWKAVASQLTWQKIMELPVNRLTGGHPLKRISWVSPRMPLTETQAEIFMKTLLRIQITK